ncbi:MAG: hypothetical protein WCW52_10410 [Elusimicrobiales bacterium]|jgi:hypothetical protein
MCKKIFICSALICVLIGSSAAGEPGSAVSISTAMQVQTDPGAGTKAPVFPQLLWEKKSAKPLTSSAISKDGSRIAIADETGYLTLYNTKGEKLWAYRYGGKLPKRAYEFRSDKADTAILNVKFSAAGKYLIGDLRVLNTWNDFRGFGRTEEYEPYRTILLDHNGKLSWQTAKEGDHYLGGDEYVLIRSWPVDESDTRPVNYYILDIMGHLQFAGKTGGDFLRGESVGISDDSAYIYLNNQIIESKSGRIVWEIANGLFEGINNDHAIVRSNNSGEIYDLISKKKLLSITTSPVFFMTKNHVASIHSEQGEGSMTVHDIETGELVSTCQCLPDDLAGHEKLLYLTKDAQYLYLGGEKNLVLCGKNGTIIWRLPVTVKPFSSFNYYSLTESGGHVLFGYDTTVKLYKSF